MDARFERQVERLRAGETGLLPEAELEPVETLPHAEDLPETDAPPLDQAVVIKLNGGLGTSMGMSGPKSKLVVKDGLTFLDVIQRQVPDGVPLVLMNSFATQGSLPEAEEFLQSRVPKLDAETLEPIEWPKDPDKQWAPPGHGDIYPSLRASGMLQSLLDRGRRYAFISNADNLGATLDPRILAYFAGSGMPFLMEVADRTEADRKGGHLARRSGRLVLREIAQTPDEDVPAFQDVSRHRFFNTNNLWVDLAALPEELDLPLIVNRKTVDPSDPSSPAVIQLETAMGAAIASFEDAGALHVPRSRFAPVKETRDLLVLRSDAYELRPDGTIALVAPALPIVSLDPEHYKLIGDLEERFPDGPPSLRECRRLTLEGDVRFGRDVIVRGEVTVHGPAAIEPGTVLTGPGDGDGGSGGSRARAGSGTGS